MKRSIYSFTKEQLQQLFVEKYNVPKYRGAQVFEWLYVKHVNSFDDMKNLPQDFKILLEKEFSFPFLECEKELFSKDKKTKKYLWKLDDHRMIESVLICTSKRRTLCLSSQVGCKFGCVFCASGSQGFFRDLEPDEIVGEIIGVMRKNGNQKPTNIVFMGMGEPLDNYDNVLQAIRIMNENSGLSIGARKITISTCGIIKNIKKLEKEGLQIELAISLHAPTDIQRDTLVPINKRYPLNKLINACNKYIEGTNRVITFEYIVIHEFNNRKEDVRNLTKLLKGLKCKVNLIPYNTVESLQFISPTKSQVYAFRDELSANGLNVTVRMSKGQDIQGACGQLVYYDHT